uniref:Uncharacterized protein n=1 Tax=Zea mays TaxID=4577 RepID=B6UGW0_MAIZE|nr:hypothetical protein [Zea mays]
MVFDKMFKWSVVSWTTLLAAWDVWYFRSLSATPSTPGEVLFLPYRFSARRRLLMCELCVLMRELTDKEARSVRCLPSV